MKVTSKLLIAALMCILIGVGASRLLSNEYVSLFITTSEKAEQIDNDLSKHLNN